MSEANDLLICIPNDVLGMQAFYNILENVIRNTAKHAKTKPELTTFTVNFIDKLANATIEQVNILNDFIVVEVFDNVNIEGEARPLTPSDIKQFEQAGLSPPDQFENEIDRLVFTQNCKINADILEEGKLRAGALGVIEMDASAAYLRKRDVSFINNSNYEVMYDESWSKKSSLHKDTDDQLRGTNCRNFLKAFAKKPERSGSIEKTSVSESGHSYLGYRFFLLRPEKILVVTDLTISNHAVRDLKKHGVWVIHAKTLRRHLEAGYVYNHEFLICQANEEFQNTDELADANYINSKSTSLPRRILNLEKQKLEHYLAKSDGAKPGDPPVTRDAEIEHQANALEKYCWELWAEKLLERSVCKHRINEPVHKCTWSIGSSYYKDTCNSIVLLTHHNHFAEDNNALTIENLSSKGFFSLPNAYKYLTLDTYFLNINRDVIAKSKLLDSAITKILVIDERVQAAAETEQFMGTVFKEYYKKMGVSIPDLNLSSHTIDSVWQNDFDKLLEIEHLDKYDFVLIHYSLLERRFGPGDGDGHINKMLDHWASSVKANIVITSGRGVPQSLTQTVSFINLSSVITTFIEIRTKYAITNLLHSARKAKHL